MWIMLFKIVGTAIMLTVALGCSFNFLKWLADTYNVIGQGIVIVIFLATIVMVCTIPDKIVKFITPKPPGGTWDDSHEL